MFGGASAKTILIYMQSAHDWIMRGAEILDGLSRIGVGEYSALFKQGRRSLHYLLSSVLLIVSDIFSWHAVWIRSLMTKN